MTLGGGRYDAMSGQRPTLRPRRATADEMLDTFALQQLVLAYCHGIDRQDLRLVRSLYHDDAIDDHGAMFRGGPDEYVAWLPSILSRWSATAHIIHNTLFLIEGEYAEGEVTVTAYHRTADGAREVIAHGRYIDQYKKRDGVWRFFRRSLALDWMEKRAVPPSGAPSTSDVTGRPSKEDPVYLRLPLFARQRES
jgi:hypothetical protein